MRRLKITERVLARDIHLPHRIKVQIFRLKFETHVSVHFSEDRLQPIESHPYKPLHRRLLNIGWIAYTARGVTQTLLLHSLPQCNHRPQFDLI